MRVLPALAFALVCAALAGCAGEVIPYRPDRAVVTSIPRERAQAELKRLLARAYPEDPGLLGAGGEPPLCDVEVDDAGFAFRGGSSGFWAQARKRYRYAEVAPSAWVREFRGRHFCVKFTA